MSVNTRNVFIEMDKDILSIRIECEHGSLYACQSISDTDVVAVRYMVDEIKREKFAVIKLHYKEDGVDK